MGVLPNLSNLCSSVSYDRLKQSPWALSRGPKKGKQNGEEGEER